MASTVINSVFLGPIWLQSGYGTPDHMGIKGTIYIDLDTAIEYINKDSFTTWDEVGGGGPSVDTYVSGMTFNNSTYDLTLNRNDGVNLTQNLSILAKDIYLTGGTYSSGTAVFTNNTGGTFNVGGFYTGNTDSYTTGATLNGTTIQFDNNTLGSNYYNVNLNPIINPKYDKTGGTITGNVTANSFIKSGGTPIQFLKADGSIDSSSYLVAADIAGKENKSEKGQPDGYTPLDFNTKVPLMYMNDALLGNVSYQGLWDQNTNNPDLTVVKPKGYYYICSGLTESTVFGLKFNTGDWIISDGTNWGKVDNTDAVSSVFGRSGNIVAVSGDYNTNMVTETTNKNYQTDNQKLFNDATSSIQTQLNGKQPILTNPITGLGTANFVAAFNSSSGLTNSTIYDTGNIIIGSTIDSGYKLKVVGGINSFIWSSSDSQVTNGYYGVLTSLPAPNTGNLYFRGGGGNGRVIGGENYGTDTAIYSNDTERIRILNNGNIGIGTTNPLTKLNIDKGGQNYSSTTPTGGLLISDLTGAGTERAIELGTDTTSAIGYLQARNTASATWYNLALNPNGGNIGIGRTNPIYVVDVKGDDGNGFAYEGASGVKVALGSSPIVGQVGTLTNHRLDFLIAATEKMSLTSNGYLGIGITTPLTKLDVFENSNSTAFLVKNGTNSFYAGNDGDGAYIGGYRTDNSNFVPIQLQKHGGNVGVGTGIPDTTFSISKNSQSTYPTLGTASGSFSILGDNKLYGLYSGIVNNGNAWLQAMTNNGSTSVYNIILQPSGGKVGIGVINPIAKFDVESGFQQNVASIGSAGAYLKGVDVGMAFGQLSVEGGYGSWMQSIRRSDEQSFRLSINPNGGNVGIGTYSLKEIGGYTSLTIGDSGKTGLLSFRSAYNGGDGANIYQDSGTGTIYFDANNAVNIMSINVQGGLKVNSFEGTTSIDIQSQDLNNLIRVGFFKGNALINAPLDSTEWWYITVESHGNGWYKQTATSFGGGANVISGGTTYIRVFTDNINWGPWRQLAFV